MKYKSYCIFLLIMLINCTTSSNSNEELQLKTIKHQKTLPDKDQNITIKESSLGKYSIDIELGNIEIQNIRKISFYIFSTSNFHLTLDWSSCDGESPNIVTSDPPNYKFTTIIFNNGLSDGDCLSSEEDEVTVDLVAIHDLGKETFYCNNFILEVFDVIITMEDGTFVNVGADIFSHKDCHWRNVKNIDKNEHNDLNVLTTD